MCSLLLVWMLYILEALKGGEKMRYYNEAFQDDCSRWELKVSPSNWRETIVSVAIKNGALERVISLLFNKCDRIYINSRPIAFMSQKMETFGAIFFIQILRYPLPLYDIRDILLDAGYQSVESNI